MQEKNILVIAGNREQFEYYISAVHPVEARKKYVYLRTVQDIYGRRVESVVLTGTYYEKKDYHDLLEMALSRVF